MRILGIDPGSLKVGFGIIEIISSERRMMHVGHGVIRLDSTQELACRIQELARYLQKMLTEIKPQHVALEDIFVGENSHSALVLGQARGAILATVGFAGTSVIHFNATTVKLTVAGTGRASKMQVGKMVQAILNLEKKPAEDAGDALAVAICCGQHLMRSLPTAISLVNQASKKKSRKTLYDLAVAQGKL